MTFITRIFPVLFVLCLGMALSAYGQKPTITPKNNPVLPLDGSGHYTIQPNDIAAFDNHGLDSPLTYNIKPLDVDCSMLGPQNINVRAITNGADPGNASFDAVGFRGNFITGVTYDSNGNLFVIEDESYSVRKITPEGKVTIFTGIGITGTIDGTKDKAMFGALHGIVADNKGNVYVSDNDYNKIRKIAPDGSTTTFAGTGFEGHADGPANTASFNHPKGIAVDSDNNIYVADTQNGMIRKITPDGVVSTLCKTSMRPYNIAAAPDGYVYWTSLSTDVSDNAGRALYRVKVGGDMEVYAGSSQYGTGAGPLGTAIYTASDVKIGPGGTLFVTDYPNVAVLMPTGERRNIATYYYEIYMTFDMCGNLVAGNRNIVLRFTMGGDKTFIAGGPAGTFEGNVPASICQFADANIPVKVQSKPTLPLIPDKPVANCSVLADYTGQIFATNNCPGVAITYTQSPVPGTPFPPGNQIEVTYTATDEYGGTDTQTFTVTNSGSGPAGSITVTQPSGEVCEGTMATFHADVANVDPSSVYYQWQVNGVNGSNGTTPDFSSTTLHNGDVVKCIVTTGGGCGVPGDNSINAKINPKAAITLKPTEEIFAGNSVKLDPTITGTANIVSYHWEPAAGLDDANAQSPLATPEVTTAYKLTVTTDKGCPAEANVTVNVIQQIKVPNAFSPNADGVNDIWEIKYLSSYSNCTVDIFNRNGQRVFRSNGYGTAWNGTLSGKALPAGVYYYIIDLKDGNPPLKGNVTIIR